MTERFDGARLLAALGSLALLVSLFLDWYGPGELDLGAAITAWTAFEITDVLLAGLALATLYGAVAAMAPSARVPAAPERLPPILGASAFVLVAISLIDVPPAASGASLETGAWIALAGSALMLTGGILSVTRISLAVTVTPREQRTDDVAAVDEPAPYGVDTMEADAVDPEETQPLPVDDEEA
jgi:hypothetical protein